MKVLLSNDDGVYAPGINILNDELKGAFTTFVVAPLEERSTTGHTLSLDNPLRVVEVGENIYGCSGYPADCSLMGFGKLMTEKPDIIVSGINRGANLGQDIYYSGTVAAAREGVFHGIPGVAISLDCNFHGGDVNKMHFESASLFMKKFLTDEMIEIIPELHLVNINVPDIPYQQIKGVKLTTLGVRKYSEEITERQDFRGRNYYWIGGVYKGFEGSEVTDCHTVSEDYISVSLLNLLGGPTDNLIKWQEYIKNFTL